MSTRRDEAELAVVAEQCPMDQIGLEMGSAPRFELFVYVDDVDERVGAMRGAGVSVLKEPKDMPWGERVG